MLSRRFRPQLEALEDRWMPSANPALSISDASVTEGDSGQTAMVFTVSLSKASSRQVSVNFATANGSATAGVDFVGRAGTLTFAPGETAKTITVLVNGDTDCEGNESFSVNLSGASRAKIADAQGVGTIVDDDDGRPRISINDVWARDGSGTTLYTFTVSLSAALGEAVTVNYATADGTATVADGDYLATFGALTFAPGETTKTVTVEVIGNASGGPTPDSGYAETFYVNLSEASGNALVVDGQGVGTIHYYDPVVQPPPGCDPSDPDYPNC